MPRYFLELGYKGTAYSGFQSQANAHSVQEEVEQAFSIILKKRLLLTGSSRTDTGVHALQNFFHFDWEESFTQDPGPLLFSKVIYQLNALLPDDIVVRDIFKVPDEAHCRFDAVSREYRYYIYHQKDPFLKDRAYYFPYKLDIDRMQEAAGIIKNHTDFTSFSKRKTQVKTFICNIMDSQWTRENEQLVFQVRANRFLRGMVRGLTATMLLVGRGKLSLGEFVEIIEAKDCTRASFAVPPQGLFLMKVIYGERVKQL